MNDDRPQFMVRYSVMMEDPQFMVRYRVHPQSEGGHVIVTEDMRTAIIPSWHYPIGRSCPCGKCICYCKSCTDLSAAVITLLEEE